MTQDPNALIQPDDQEPVAPPEPQAPQIDLEQAYRVVADNEGWDPRLARFEMQEHKRRKEELDKRERELDQRYRIPEPREQTPDFGGDQFARMVYEAKQDAAETKRLLLEDREERRNQREKDELVASLSKELDSSFQAAARQSGMTKDQISAQGNDFYALLTDIYPEPEMIKRLGADRAVRNAFRVFKGGVGSAPRQPSYRDPRATFIVPGGSTTSTQENNTQDDFSPQREGETPDQATERRLKALQGRGFNKFPDGFKVNSG